MKSTVTISPIKIAPDYPCIKICKTMAPENRFVVLFIAKGVGTVVQVEIAANYALGHHSSYWSMDNFQPLKGSVTLSDE